MSRYKLDRKTGKRYYETRLQIHLPKMSERALADVRQQLRQVAYELGYPQTRGSQARLPGHGSAGQLLIGMLSGEVLTVRLRPEQLAAAIHALNPVDEPWADAIVERLYDQLRRLRSLAPQAVERTR